MGWKTVVVAGSVLVAVLGGVGWAVSAPATEPSPVIGPPVIVIPAAKELPTFEPTEPPDPPVESRPPSRAPSHSPTRATTSPPTPVPTVTYPDHEPPEMVTPQRVRPVEHDDDDDDGADSAEVDDD